jgi:Tfp pilus assembly protein PilN
MCGYLRRRDPGYARLFEDSINLLPYRGLRAARRRSRYFIQLLLAACLGLVAALSMGYWQQIHVARGDAHTAQLQQSLQQLQAAQAEHAQLEQVIAAYAHRAALVASLAVARDNLFHLLAALGRDPAAGLSLDEIRYRDGRATLTGVVPDQRVLTAWVGQLEQAVGLATVEIVELQNAARRDSPRRNRDRVDGAAPAAFSVRVAVGDEDSPDAAQAVSARGSLSSGRGGLHLAAGGVMSAAQPYRQIEPSSAQLAAPGAVP